MNEGLKGILDFITKTEQLKKEMRHSWLSNGRQESVAEHTWRMSLMAMLLHDRLSTKVDIGKVLKMVITHDLVEVEAGDVPVLDIIRNPALKTQKQAREQGAIANIKDTLGGDTGNEIYALWHEFEAKTTPEAKFANALDKLEVQIQHNQAHFDTWEELEYELVYMMDAYVAHDPALTVFKEMVVEEADSKMRQNGVEIDRYKP